MVDPNRKINRLTDKDIEFLDECEEEFAYRFTDDDEEFVKHCAQAVPEPPIVQNWGEFNRNPHHNHYGGNYQNNRRWNNQRRGGGRGGYRGGREKPYHRHDQNSRDNWNTSR